MKAIKQVDVVISTVGYLLLADQVKIIDAIKEAGNIKVLILNSLYYEELYVVSGAKFDLICGIIIEIVTTFFLRTFKMMCDYYFSYEGQRECQALLI